MTVDLLITGGTVIDGTGAPAHQADVAISGSRIVEVAPLRAVDAVRRIDATGLCVTPGFIDAHGHSDLALLADGCVAAKVAQGVTTEILGQDGLSYAPLSPDRLSEQCQYLAALNGACDGVMDWRSWNSFPREYVGRTSQNVSFLVPYGAVRIEVAGWADRALSDEEVVRSSEIVDGCMSDGALGVALGLDYFPQSVASTAEITALGIVVARHDGVLVAHTRNRALGIVRAVRELVEIGAITGAKVHVSHLRAAQALPVIDDAISRGIDVSFDVYPYLVGSSMLAMHLPGWLLADGPTETLRRLRDASVRARLQEHLQDRLGPSLDDFVLANVGQGRYVEHVGQTLAAVVLSIGGGLANAFAELLTANDMAVGYVGAAESEESVAACIRHPAAMGCSDAILVGQRPHPRGWGAFPRFFRSYVRESKLLTIEECVRKLTSTTASRFGLGGRGTVAPGMAADLVLFDPDTIADEATFDEPRRPPRGIRTVVVNGQIVWDAESCTGSLSGEALRRSAE